jgi:hypothetical protein
MQSVKQETGRALRIDVVFLFAHSIRTGIPRLVLETGVELNRGRGDGIAGAVEAVAPLDGQRLRPWP